MRTASQGLRAGSEARALSILSALDFDVPPAEVLRRLGNLPRRRIVAAATGMSRQPLSLEAPTPEKDPACPPAAARAPRSA